MEFIDPVIKQKKAKRLKIGYSLLSLLVVLATYILVATAMGYEVFQRDGQIIQNGIIFMDSKPIASDIYVNGRKEDNGTDTRLTLPEGEYEIVLKANGYKDWAKKIVLSGGTVKSLTYPRLFPENLNTTDLKTYESSNYGLISQSPNKRWILFQPEKKSLLFNIIDTSRPNSPQQELSVPPEVIGANDGKIGLLEVVEWADDNKHFLIKHSLDNIPPVFIIIDKDDLAKSININTTFNLQPTKISLFGGQIDKVYIYIASGGILKTGDLKSKTVGNQLIDQVLDFKQINKERIMYVTTKDSSAGKVIVKAINEGKEFLIGETDFDSTSKYFLDAGEYFGDWYYVIGASQAEKVQVYRNPQNFVASEIDNTPNVLSTLRPGIARNVRISPGNRFILAQGDSSFIVYDVVDKKSYRTNLTKALDKGTVVEWVDEHILQYAIDSELIFTEFDGNNQRQLNKIKSPFGGFIDGSFSRLYTLRDNNGAITSQLTLLTVTD